MIRAVAILAALAVGLSFQPSASAAEDPYVINVIASLTGTAAFIGQSIAKTVGVVETVVNRSGGIRGRPVKFVIADDGSSPQSAVQLASKLVADKVPVFLGPAFTATCAATAPIAQANRVVMDCMSPGIIPQPGGYVFAIGPTTDAITLAGIRYLRERGWTRIAVLSSTDASGQAWDVGVEHAMAQPESKDLQIVAHEHMNVIELSVAAQLARIKAANPQALMLLPTGPPFGTALRDFADVGMSIPVLGSTANLNRAQLASYASFMPKELYFPGPISLVPGTVGSGPTKDAQTVYFNGFKAIGVRPDTGQTIAWDPSLLVISALRAIGPNATAEQIRDYLEGVHGWVGIDGVYDFRDGLQRGVNTVNSVAVYRYDNVANDYIPLSRPGGHLK
jgi:branched-chain amino acid transport system substrate-binding protein